MRKNWKLFLKEINSDDRIVEINFLIEDIKLNETLTPLEPLIEKWKIFFKKKILQKNININEIKSRIYHNNKEAFYLKKFMCKNAINNINGNNIDTYQFMDFINNTKLLSNFNLEELPKIISNDKLSEKKNNINSYKKYFNFDNNKFENYFNNLKKNTSLVNRYINNNLDYWNIKFLNTFNPLEI